MRVHTRTYDMDDRHQLRAYTVPSYAACTRRHGLAEMNLSPEPWHPSQVLWPPCSRAVSPPLYLRLCSIVLRLCLFVSSAAVCTVPGARMKGIMGIHNNRFGSRRPLLSCVACLSQLGSPALLCYTLSEGCPCGVPVLALGYDQVPVREPAAGPATRLLHGIAHAY